MQLFTCIRDPGAEGLLGWPGLRHERSTRLTTSPPLSSIHLIVIQTPRFRKWRTQTIVSCPTALSSALADQSSPFVRREQVSERLRNTRGHYAPLWGPFNLRKRVACDWWRGGHVTISWESRPADQLRYYRCFAFISQLWLIAAVVTGAFVCGLLITSSLSVCYNSCLSIMLSYVFVVGCVFCVDLTPYFRKISSYITL